MVSPRNLQGIDAAWLAVDAAGCVAIFTTGGEGPIPEAAVALAQIAEESVSALQEISGYELLTTVKRSDDFIAFARRGLFAYDWSDVHRVTRNRLAGYSLQVRPYSPLQLAELPASVQVLAAATKLSSVVFGSSLVVPGELVGT